MNIGKWYTNDKTENAAFDIKLEVNKAYLMKKEADYCRNRNFL